MNKLDKVILAASVTLNLSLVLLIFREYSSYSQAEFEYKAQLDSQKNRQAKSLAEIGKRLTFKCPLISGTDTVHFETLLSDNSFKVFFVTGFINCSSCIYREIERLEEYNIPNMVVISDKSTEEEIQYYWKKNKIKYPLFFTDIDRIGLTRDILSQPSYLIIDDSLRVTNMIILEKNDSFQVGDYFLKSLSLKYDSSKQSSN
ncbi:hypothetical protein [Rhodoflexus caldus]|uniref:hypothetical protein n=1 Tax=Rhodoflexus caldus TaxID=2891236 RepID=UPI00202A41FB|nr:hypothetical protein [Rhodoflexus caldus]